MTRRNRDRHQQSFAELPDSGTLSLAAAFSSEKSQNLTNSKRVTTILAGASTGSRFPLNTTERRSLRKRMVSFFVPSRRTRNEKLYGCDVPPPAYTCELLGSIPVQEIAGPDPVFELASPVPSDWHSGVKPMLRNLEGRFPTSFEMSTHYYSSFAGRTFEPSSSTNTSNGSVRGTSAEYLSSSTPISSYNSGLDISPIQEIAPQIDFGCGNISPVIEEIVYINDQPHNNPGLLEEFATYQQIPIQPAYNWHTTLPQHGFAHFGAVPSSTPAYAQTAQNEAMTHGTSPTQVTHDGGLRRRHELTRRSRVQRRARRPAPRHFSGDDEALTRSYVTVRPSGHNERDVSYCTQQTQIYPPKICDQCQTEFTGK